jgi:hypothetical protein
MKRKALLIESSRLTGQPDLPGARIDIRNWRSFLRSDVGGAWNDDEIISLNNPSWPALQGQLILQSSTDYVFITFSGHGEHIREKDIDESKIYLTENDKVLVRQINPGNPRCTFIIDACRGLVTPEALPVAIAMSISKAVSDRQAYRDLFDAAIEQAEKGIIRVFSCSIDEAAGESAISGGYYTTALMDCCTDWHRSHDSGKRYYYPINSAHDCASSRTTERNKQQHPQYNGGRRNKHFPLAVKP